MKEGGGGHDKVCLKQNTEWWKVKTAESENTFLSTQVQVCTDGSIVNHL